MNGGKDMLHAARVLILEDDYYLATDLQLALEAAGARVLGPFADTESAVEALAIEPPDCALVDLNLGRGINFKLPHELACRAIPFAFVTGYDRDAIPDEFVGFARVEKPVAVQRVAQIAAGLLAAQRT